MNSKGRGKMINPDPIGNRSSPAWVHCSLVILNMTVCEGSLPSKDWDAKFGYNMMQFGNCKHGPFELQDPEVSSIGFLLFPGRWETQGAHLRFGSTREVDRHVMQDAGKVLLTFSQVDK